MNKFLFNDGSTGVKEVHSVAELQQLIEATEDRDKIRIWIFHTNEWISYAAFTRTRALPPNRTMEKPVNGMANTVAAGTRPAKKFKLVRHFLTFIVLVGAGLLVFNFTRIGWEKANQVSVTATRPDNTPTIDVDSLVWTIETQRGQKLDRSTRTNLRLRNTWPDRVLVQLNATRETNKSNGSRFSGVEVKVDNTTGFMIDDVVLNIVTWSDREKILADTLHFSNIGFSGPVNRMIDKRYRGDSISVHVATIRARSFNFCYSSTTENEDHHYDPWFCRDDQ